MSQRKQSEDLYRRINPKEGAHLASSQDTPGAYRGTLYDDNSNKLVGHAEWEKVDESEYEWDYSYDNQEAEELSTETQELQRALEDVLAKVFLYVMEEHVAPRVQSWWQNTVAPFTKGMWEGITNRKKDKMPPKDKKSDLHTNEIIIVNETVHKLSSHKLEEAYEKYRNDMTSEEAQEELLDIFILSAVLTAKIRKLSNARIIEDGDAPEHLEGQKILERLITPEYINCVNQILDSNPQLLKEKTAFLSEILGRSLISNGQYAPIEIGKFKEVIILQSASE